MSKTTIPRGGITADAINGTLIADDAIDSEHYTDGSIDTAHIGNSQVTSAKTSGIGGRATLIDTITLSSSSTAIFDSSDITSTYDNYIITLENVATGSGNVEVIMRISNNNGSSYEGDSANDYRFISYAATEDTSDNNIESRFSTGQNKIGITGNRVNNGNDAALKIDSTIECFSLNSSSYKKFIIRTAFSDTTDPPNLVYEHTLAMADSTQAVINNIKIYPSSGTLASGKIKLFGLS